MFQALLFMHFLKHLSDIFCEKKKISVKTHKNMASNSGNVVFGYSSHRRQNWYMPSGAWYMASGKGGTVHDIKGLDQFKVFQGRFQQIIKAAKAR